MPTEDTHQDAPGRAWTYTLAIASAVGLAASGPLLLDSWRGTASVETALFAFLAITTLTAAVVTFVTGTARRAMAAAPTRAIPSSADADPAGAHPDRAGTDAAAVATADEPVAA